MPLRSGIRKKSIGGMCHYLLPRRGNSQRLPKGFYADDVISLFLNEMKKIDTVPSDYETKIFGGGNMFCDFGEQCNPITVSQNNIDTGLELLKMHSFNITAADTGGGLYRKIYLELWNGDVWLQAGSAGARECG